MTVQVAPPRPSKDPCSPWGAGVGATATPTPVEPLQPPTPTKAWEMVECPACGAGVGERCTTAGTGSPHRNRSRLGRAARWEELNAALVRLARDHVRTPCATSGEPDAWTSDDEESRAIAAMFCEACPIREVCGRTGRTTRQPFVWGGVDLGPAKPS